MVALCTRKTFIIEICLQTALYAILPFRLAICGAQSSSVDGALREEQGRSPYHFHSNGMRNEIWVIHDLGLVIIIIVRHLVYTEIYYTS